MYLRVQVFNNWCYLFRAVVTAQISSSGERLLQNLFSRLNVEKNLALITGTLKSHYPLKKILCTFSADVNEAALWHFLIGQF